MSVIGDPERPRGVHLALGRGERITLDPEYDGVKLTNSSIGPVLVHSWTVWLAPDLFDLVRAGTAELGIDVLPGLCAVNVMRRLL